MRFKSRELLSLIGEQMEGLGLHPTRSSALIPPSWGSTLSTGGLQAVIPDDGMWQAAAVGMVSSCGFGRGIFRQCRGRKFSCGTNVAKAPTET